MSIDLTQPRRIHMIGVGGAGMSGLAKLLHQMGHTVTGSDMKMGSIMHDLADLGLDVWEGSAPERVSNLDLLVASSAVPGRDPERRAAEDAGVLVWDRPDLLEALTRDILHTIGPTGTHGKTTSTALLVAALRALGRDPSFVVGGLLSDFGTRAHLGERDLFVLEADEAFGTFTRLHLRGLMVTNVEADHLDYYGTLDRIEDTFADVVRRVDGPVVVGIDDPGGRRLAERTGRFTYGTATDADWRITDVDERGDSVSFRLTGPDASTDVTVGRPGIHIARNAAGALALLGSLGFDVATAADVFPDFRGVHRRFEIRARVGGVTIIDDYAHHPTEVAANLRAARAGGWRTIWAVFQPHLYSRTEAMALEFGSAFDLADKVIVTDVYGAREAPVPGVTGELVADAAKARTEADVFYVPRRGDVAAFLAERVREGDLVLTMGAGDVTLIPNELAPLLAGVR
jgi:UDP-N-acetylmuramate--alanine ligase